MMYVALVDVDSLSPFEERVEVFVPAVAPVLLVLV